jgi:hypothetical protein
MTDQWADRLSEYLDEDLDPAERAEIDAHLAGCRECAATLDELREVVTRAAAMPAVPPTADLWPGVEARLTHGVVAPFTPRPARRFSFTFGQLVAAGLALMVLSGGSVWLSQFGGRNTSLPPVDTTTLDSGIAPVMLSDPRYDQAVTDLQNALAAGRSQLDPETVRILESNLQAIDHAIDQSRRALQADPANIYLNSHLAEARQRKLALLRRASALVNAKS